MGRRAARSRPGELPLADVARSPSLAWRDLALGAALGLGVLAALVGAYLGSALIFANLDVLMDPVSPERLGRLVRFNLVGAVVIAFTAATLTAFRPAVGRDFEALRTEVDASPEQWESWRRRLLAPAAARLASALALGAMFGLALTEVGGALTPSGASVGWSGNLGWLWILQPLLFALLGLMVLLSITTARVFAEMGVRVRVRLLDPGGLRPFARVGLRSAIFWLLGSSIASLLTIDASVPWLVAAILVITLGVGFAALLIPSRGLHRRLRGAKEVELRWVRRAIEDARNALAAGGPGKDGEAARLPALLAYEHRVTSVSEWPFDTPTLVRFALFLLVPLGSWLGGALVEHVVNLWLG
jgi:hypothetical protein